MQTFRMCNETEADFQVTCVYVQMCLCRFSTAEASLVMVDEQRKSPWRPPPLSETQTAPRVNTPSSTFKCTITGMHTYTHNYSLTASTGARLYIILCITIKEWGFPTKRIGLVWKIVALKSKYLFRNLFKCPVIQSVVTLWKSDQDAAAKVSILPFYFFFLNRRSCVQACALLHMLFMISFQPYHTIGWQMDERAHILYNQSFNFLLQLRWVNWKFVCQVEVDTD